VQLLTKEKEKGGGDYRKPQITVVLFRLFDKLNQEKN
jgi:hypothetical protein